MLTADRVRTCRGGQDGQALVAVLVILALVFALAGALISVGSALLTQVRVAQDPLAAEVAASNAQSGALAQIGDRGMVSGAAGPCTAPSVLMAVVPGLPGASCLRIDNVSTAAGDHGVFPLAWSNPPCSMTKLPSPGSATHIVAWFVARSSGSPPTAYVSSQSPSCQVAGSNQCTTLAAAQADGAFLASFDCDLSTWPAGSAPYLHVISQSTRPLDAWWAKYLALDDTYRTGSIYALSIPTGLVTADIVEAHVLVPSDAQPARGPTQDLPTLLWRAPLP